MRRALYNFLVISLVGSCFLPTINLYSQQLTLSPYSRYGIGEILSSTTTRNDAMGGISVATDNYFSINRGNPASYADLLFTTLDVSGFGQVSSLRSDSQDENQNTAGFQSIALGFPANNNFSLILGFAPYSVVGYDVRSSTEGVAVGDSLTAVEVTENEGEGGLNQVFIGGGYKLLNTKLRIGGNFSYYFGESIYSSSTEIENSTQFQGVRFEQQIFLRGLGAQLGIQYVDSLKANSRTLFRIGATVDWFSNLNSTREDIFEGLGSIGVNPSVDTFFTEEGNVDIPIRFGVGIMIHQLGKWSLGADIIYQDWDEFSILDDPTELGKDIRIGVGGEFIPDITSRNYFKRIALRAGGFYRQTYIRLGDEAVSESGISFGFSLPSSAKSISRFDQGKASSRINLSFTLGQRGNISSNQLVEELFVRIRLGLSLNDTWFIRRAVD